MRVSADRSTTVRGAVVARSGPPLLPTRVFCKYDQVETAPGAPNVGQPGFEHVLGAVSQLQAAGFGFGQEGADPGAFYDFDQVSKSTPTDPDLNTFAPDTD